MLNTETELRELDREFTSSETMTAEIFAARRDKILARAATAPVAATPAPAASPVDGPITKKFFESVLSPIVKSIAKTFRADDAKLEARIAALETRLSNDALPRGFLGRHRIMMKAETELDDAIEARILALEQKPQMTYRGVWSESEQYSCADIATHSGCLWFCREPTRARPGTSAWQLMHKTVGR